MANAEKEQEKLDRLDMFIGRLEELEEKMRRMYEERTGKPL